jgi:hypothetical protein
MGWKLLRIVLTVVVRNEPLRTMASKIGPLAVRRDNGTIGVVAGVNRCTFTQGQPQQRLVEPMPATTPMQVQTVQAG